MATVASPAPAKPAPLDPVAIKVAPAPLLNARRGSGTKIGSRATDYNNKATTSTGGDVTTPTTPPMPYFSATDKSLLRSIKVQPAAAAPTAAAVDEGAAPNNAKDQGAATPTSTIKLTVRNSPAETPRNASPNSINAPAGDSTTGSEGAPKVANVPTFQLKVSKSLSSKVPSAASTPRQGRSRSGSVRSVASGGKASTGASPKIEGPVAAGVQHKSKYAIMRPSLRSIPGRSYTDSDILNLRPPTPRERSTTPQSKRHTSQSYKSTRIIFTNAESKTAEAEDLIRNSKRDTVNNTRTTEAPWDHDQWKAASPKRSGSAKPAYSGAAPWEKEAVAAGSLERSSRSHSAAATSYRRECPFGTTPGADAAHFHRGEEKIVQFPKPVCGRPTNGKDCSISRMLTDNDVMNSITDAPDNRAPSGRRPPPPSAYEESEEYNRRSCIRIVEPVVHVDKPTGLRGHPMATAAQPGSPFRTARDDDRFRSLSPSQSVCGPQHLSSKDTRRGGRVLLAGRSCGVQSMHLDPTNEDFNSSNFSPSKAARRPNMSRGRANIESAPDADLFSQHKVDPVRASRHKESLVGVLFPAPAVSVPSYTVVPPFWTNELL